MRSHPADRPAGRINKWFSLIDKAASERTHGIAWEKVLLAVIGEWMESAELTLHPEKTRVVDMGVENANFDFLGYRFQRSRKGKLLRLVRPASKKKLRETLRQPTKRTSGKSMEVIIAGINPVLRGWHEYFKHTLIGEHRKMDQRVRMRLRSILRKRHKGQGRGRGKDRFKWPHRYFETLGLFSLEQARIHAMNLHNGAKR